VTVILVAVIFLGQQVYEGMLVENDISNLSHILGGIIGAIFGYFLNITPV
jgi:GlpG protein